MIIIVLCDVESYWNQVWQISVYIYKCRSIDSLIDR
jgi:hypothetical protein